jgi:uncharacterized protein YcbK (DUF882 family)
LRLALLAGTMMALGGCMSSPGDELASIRTLPQVHHNDSTQQKTVRVQQVAANDPQSAIAAQAAEDTRLLNEQAAAQSNTLNGQAAVLEAAARKRRLAAELARTNSLLANRNIAAAQTSIYANPNNGTVELTADPQQVALNQTANGIEPVQPMNAAQNSIFAGQTDVAARDNGALPLPDAQKVSADQDLALAGQPLPSDVEVASADPVNDVAAEPDTMPSYRKALDQSQAEQPVVEPKKRRLTLADLFRRSKTRQVASFDADRFGKKRELNTQAIPNMQTASLDQQALPGVNGNAMMPVGNLSEDDLSADPDDDQPAGLMKLASLPSMTRQAPNGLWTQTDTVEVRCFRPQLVNMLKQVENHYGRPVVVTSGYRDPNHNRQVGGAQHSMHTLCAAADIQLDGVSKWALADYLRSIPGRGGVGTYCHTDSVHIDLGEERDWNWRCRRRRHG